MAHGGRLGIAGRNGAKGGVGADGALEPQLGIQPFLRPGGLPGCRTGPGPGLPLEFQEDVDHVRVKLLPLQSVPARPRLAQPTWLCDKASRGSWRRRSRPP